MEAVLDIRNLRTFFYTREGVAQAVNGVLYNGNATLRNEANAVFGAVNQDGGIG